MRVKIFADFPEALGSIINIDHDKKIEVHIDHFMLERLTPVPEDTIRFFVTAQPEGDYNQVIRDNQDCFTYLLTQQDELLSLPKARLFVGCGSFIDPCPDIEKKFAVSTVFSGRDNLPGHKLRHELYERRGEITIPFDIYTGAWHPINDTSIKCLEWPNRKDKIRVMDCMFHIAIDSYRRDNQICEKLIDPLITKTIPILWGCTNLSDFYNPDGIIEVATVDEIIQKTNLLTPDMYYQKMTAIDDNYNRAVKTYRYEDILRNIIIKTLI